MPDLNVQLSILQIFEINEIIERLKSLNGFLSHEIRKRSHTGFLSPVKLALRSNHKQGTWYIATNWRTVPNIIIHRTWQCSRHDIAGYSIYSPSI